MKTDLLLASGGSGFEGRINNPTLGKFLNSGLISEPEWYFQTFIPKGVGLLLVIGAIAFFFMFIWGAITWIFSGGDKAGVESARSKITNALIGIVLLFGSFAVVKLIERFFGIDILSIDIGPLVIQ